MHSFLIIERRHDAPALLRLTRRRWLSLCSAGALAGCGGGDEAVDIQSGLPDRETIAAASLAGESAGGVFNASGVTQTVLAGATDQFFHFGSFSKVLIVPKTLGQGVVASRGAPATLGSEDELSILSANADVLVAAGARGFNLRRSGLVDCSVQLVLGS